MNITFIRGLVSDLYPNRTWRDRVESMPDDQVLAIWIRYKSEGQKPDQQTMEPGPTQLRLF